jgi:hypothetical protein
MTCGSSPGNVWLIAKPAGYSTWPLKANFSARASLTTPGCDAVAGFGAATASCASKHPVRTLHAHRDEEGVSHGQFFLEAEKFVTSSCGGTVSRTQSNFSGIAKHFGIANTHSECRSDLRASFAVTSVHVKSPAIGVECEDVRASGRIPPRQTGDVLTLVVRQGILLDGCVLSFTLGLSLTAWTSQFCSTLLEWAVTGKGTTRGRHWPVGSRLRPIFAVVGFVLLRLRIN